jgi:photosystem II stability/assembly factor-like uncharacterized protein
MKETKSVAIDPFDSAVVWVANDQGLNKSTDCGATWTLVSTGPTAASLNMNSSLWSIALDPVHQGTIYLVGGYGALGLWKSTNGGVDWVDLVAGGSEYAKVQDERFVNNISMDPSDPLHLVFATHGACAAPYAPTCDGESFDGGATWKLSVAPSGWAEGGGVMVLDKTTWLWNSPTGTKTEPGGIWRTEDNGQSFQKVFEGNGGNGEFTNQPIVAASDGAYYLSSVGGVLRSADKGKTWMKVRDGRWVGFAMSSTKLYVSDQWSPKFAWALITDPMTWHDLPSPPGLSDTQGGPILAYDEDHHVLYATTWPFGLQRLVTQ